MSLSLYNSLSFSLCVQTLKCHGVGLVVREQLVILKLFLSTMYVLGTELCL